MVQKAKKRFFSLFSIIIGSILTLFSGAKSLEAQSVAENKAVDFTPPSAWADIKSVTPSKAYHISPSDKSVTPSKALPSTHSDKSVTQPNGAMLRNQGTPSGTQPSSAMQSSSTVTAPTKMAIRNQGAPTGTYPSQAIKIHQNEQAGASPTGARQVEQPNSAYKADQLPSTSYAFFERPSAVYKVHMNQPEESAFEGWLKQQGFESKNLSNIELDAAFTEFRLEQIERRLDQTDIER